MLDNKMTAKTIIFWWPDATFNDVHWKKDPGSIPIELKRLGYKVILAVGKFASSKRSDEIDIIETNIHEKSSFAMNIINRINGFLSMIKIMRKHHPDTIIVEHSQIEAVLIMTLLKFYKKIIFKHSPLLILKLDADPESPDVQNNNSIYVFYRYIYTKSFDYIACESECSYNILTKPRLIEKYKNKYRIIPDGFYYDRISDNNNYPRQNIILSVGRIHPQKGHDILIEIFSKLKDKFPDWQLRIAGLVDDQSYMKALKKQIIDLNLCNSVKLITNISDEELIKEYKQSSIFCLLSRWGGFDIAKAEAIHYGLPIVITEAACGIYYKKYGSFVCNINDKNSIFEALSTLMSNPALRLEISKKQKDAILTWRDVALEFKKLIEIENN
ncbi:glycosyltransferase [Picrophilus oshimae]|uniref:Lipopolysaccharide N-acetylglucosaminyltransferase n=1 Tax=Picrophilus torridus (strain ATCC 700027 / DSM 9790 / JCM 10055 / NBRC 100828 / KAW 2/3) TaxID=1122961 RepID=Q6L2B9_PICTO|nr:glycosyltransferase [Picrophilus oshimae]AAT42883.1 lipopolysaccharide N-acetylglucosaminyltransferase [Picrophilus oshimae DSM 9789]